MIFACLHSIPRISAAAMRPAKTIGVIGHYADGALRAELMLTPKPGLVDRRNCGAHHDMTMQTFLASVCALAPWWSRFTQIGYACASMPADTVLPMVRPAGVQSEQAMAEVTDGVNTHKGAIFSLGLLCTAAGRLLAGGTALTREGLCAEVSSMCVGLVDRELNSAHRKQTAGERVFRHYGFAGARGEAASGYALVRRAALPVYDRLRRIGVDEHVALLQVLLHLLALNRDTNLVSRGGLDGLDYVQTYAQNLLREGGVLTSDGVKKMEAFDDALIARHLSPGGTADLLAVTWFLAQFPSSGWPFSGAYKPEASLIAGTSLPCLVMERCSHR
jgi:triphosphoribosyl-dephospho-CoA synthase